jgi:hypothetical protein
MNARRLWRRYCDNFRYLWHLTRADIWTGAAFLPGSRIYNELRDYRREQIAAAGRAR